MAEVIRSILIIIKLWTLVFGNPTDKCLKPNVPCGGHKCCCTDQRATCRDLGHRLSYIPPLPNITELEFVNNYLPNLYKERFANISNVGIIRKLSLAYNHISNISSDVFSSFDSLQSLTLDGNSKLDVPQLWVALGSIQKTLTCYVSLQHMGLVDIKDEMFSNLRGANISRVDLSNNEISVFTLKPFQNLKTLEGIILQKNKIREISTDCILSSVVYIDISDNAIVGEIEKDSFCSKTDGKSIFPNLRRLLLQDNFIGVIKSYSFHCLESLEKLNLNGNVVKVLENNMVAHLYSLQELQFAYMHRSISKIMPYAFNNSNMKYLNFRENYIVLKPDTAKVIFQNSSNLKTLDISLTNLKRLSPEQIIEMLSPLKSLEKLTASRCQIIRIADNFLESFQNLTQLNLDGNSIHTIGTPFKNVYSLKRLSLQGNALSSIKEDDVSENFMTSLETINLSNNPYDCTCSLLWFRSMINNETAKFGSISLITWPRRYECMTPTNLMKTELQKYQPTKSSCTNLLRIVVICLVSFMVVVCVVSIVTFRYRWYIRYWFYKLKTHRKDPEKTDREDPEKTSLLKKEEPQYDGYIIYNINDRFFVHHDLRLFMEDKHRYKMHIWGRDGAVGGSELEAMVDSIYASRYAVAVISKNSLQDSWVQFQMNVALDRQVELKKDFLMLVILEDFDFQKLSKYWCVMFTKIRSASWCKNEEDVKHAVFEQQLVRHFGGHRNKTVQ